MDEHTEALDQLMNTIADEIKSRVPSVTGKTAAAIEVTTKSARVGLYENVKSELRGPISLIARETGRGPTKRGSSSGETLQQQLLKYIKAKGITPDDPKMTQEQLSWAFAFKMHKEGDRLYSDPPNGYKKSGVISDSINDQRLDSLFDVFLNSQRDVLSKKLANFLKR